MRSIQIRHRATDVVIAAGPLGWGITPFEGNYYISKRYLRAGRFVMNGIPGLCIYKFIYVWLDLHLPDGLVEKNLGWRYCLPNPLLPFIWFRVAIPANTTTLSYETTSA
ncbi:MAG TPA: hypothetical protein VNF68_05540 [Candidatus Baltobacteraceae bacterium]|nr:hypothetical protein [Candidatus Baltobacteraceae bacterium]